MGTWGLGAPGSTPAGSGFQGQRRHQPADPAPRRHQTGEGRGHKLELARGLSCKALELADEVGLVVKGVAHKVLPVDTLTGKRSEEHTSELQSLMRISYAVFCLKKKTKTLTTHQHKHRRNKSRRE